MLHRVGLAPTISVHARGEVIAGSSRALLLKLPVHGAGERARTVDLLITNQLLCQLSYTSIKNGYRRTRVYLNCSCLCLLCCRTALPSQSCQLIQLHRVHFTVKRTRTVIGSIYAAGTTFVYSGTGSWLQRWDLNPRPSGYEPDELPAALLCYICHRALPQARWRERKVLCATMNNTGLVADSNCT